MMMRLTLSLTVMLALTACGHPTEVQSLASSALPIATNLRTTAAAQHSRFALQRTMFDGRAAELEQQAALARDSAYQREQDWKFQGETALPKKLALFREGDAAILADPLAPFASSQSATSKPPALDLAALGKVIAGFDQFRQTRAPNGGELLTFFHSVNAKLVEIEKEKTGANAQPVEDKKLETK